MRQMSSITLPGFDHVEELHRGRYWVDRWVRLVDRRPAVGKRLPPHVDDRAAAARLRHEAQIIYKLHEDRLVPGAVRPLELIEGPSPVLVFEDTRAYALPIWLAQTPLTVRQVLRIAHGLATALVWVHSAGMLHKNINPRNVVYNRNANTVELIDFSSAAPFGRAGQRDAALRQTLASLPYLAPEQADGKRRGLDARTDLYALGATCYMLLCGTLPFADPGLQALTAAVIAQAPLPLAMTAPTVPDPVAAIIHTLMAKAPRARYQSAQALLVDLDACIKDTNQAGKIATSA